MKPSLDIRFVVEIPFESLNRPALSYDHELLNGRTGIHPVTRQRGVPAEAMPPPEEHLRRLIETGRVDPDQFAFTLTHRNAFQNLRCPLWSADQGLCQSDLEQVQQSRRPYYGVAYAEDGTVRLVRLDFRQPVPEGLRSHRNPASLLKTRCPGAPERLQNLPRCGRSFLSLLRRGTLTFRGAWRPFCRCPDGRLDAAMSPSGDQSRVISSHFRRPRS